ncbi:hypothetical protein BE17_39425 [Sorangium cellulosum]|uniref:PE_PGRS family protein n=1 Tax=Sorangium cellulosum TaxID=56 RepID=A0A150SDW9_SORCE|nr:hypothetical protein BE17_39425 [Sorangium cellulosum]
MVACSDAEGGTGAESGTGSAGGDETNSSGEGPTTSATTTNTTGTGVENPTSGTGGTGGTGGSGDATGSGGSGDASGSGGAGGDDPFAQAPVCSSDEHWTMGDHESPLMHPGMACRTCHSMKEPRVAMRLPIVGTVFPTGHEPDDCLGVDGEAEDVVVEITTADARVIQLPVNASGNFLFDTFQDRTPINFPITARVVKGDKERKMLTAQMSGDCNSCHSQSGAEGAPGRIVAP